MKVTIDIPEELYRQVKARSALEGRTVREVAVDLYGRWLASSSALAPSPSPGQWLEDWLTLADEVVGAPGEATAREHLAAARGRLEKRRADG